MAQTIGDNSTKTKAGNTRRVELLWKVLDSAHVSGLVSAKPAIIEVGKMGERPVQDSRYKVVETKV